MTIRLASGTLHVKSAEQVFVWEGSRNRVDFTVSVSRAISYKTPWIVINITLPALFVTGRLLSVMIRIDAASKQEVVVAETSVELDKTVGEKKYLRLSEVQETNVYFRRNKKE